MDAAGAEDVAYICAGDQQIIRDDTAMAAPPNRLRTHDCWTMVCCQHTQFTKPGAECRCRGIVGIVAETCIIPERVRRRPGTFPSSTQPAQQREMPISDSVSRQRSGERVAIELRVGGRPR